MITEINERVKVVAVFDCGPRPVKFLWNGRVREVKEVTAVWNGRRGRVGVVHFSVSDGSALYEMAYDKSTMEWTLLSVEAW